MAAVLTLTRRALVLVGLALGLAGCAAAAGPSGAEPRPRAICLDEPRRGEPGDPMRPLVFLLCVQTP